MKRYLPLLIILALSALLACQRAPTPASTVLYGAWQDPLTGWTYTFNEDGSYLGQAPLLADGVNQIEGVFVLDDEGYLEFALAQQAPRRPWTFYERRNVWQVIEFSPEQLLLACGRDRVRLVRHSATPAPR